MDANLTAETPDANRQHKDSVFTMLFDDEAALIELASALLGVKYGPDTPIKITTLKNVLANGRVNDLSFILDNRIIVLVEHQSTRNDFMPYRMLLYIAETFSLLYEQALQYHRGIGNTRLNRPKFFMLYNGAEEMKEDKIILRLSDLFAKLTPEEKAAFGDIIDLELTVTVYNIKDGRNAHIVNFCEKLRGYAIFTDMIRENRKTMTLEEAIRKAVEDCIALNILREFLEKHKQEVIGMLLTEWDWDTALAVSKEEGVEKGRAEGRAEGLEEGLEKGLEKGLEEGLEKGREEGLVLAKEGIARAMKEEGADVKFIAKVTNLPLDTILKL